MGIIKVSAKYWETLSEKEKLFLRNNVYDYGLIYCKRLITLLRLMGGDDIQDFKRYKNNNPIYSGNFAIFLNGKLYGLIYKSVLGGYGITERIKLKEESGEFREVWNNWAQRNPAKRLFA